MVALFVMLTIATLILAEVIVGKIEGRRLVVVRQPGRPVRIAAAGIPKDTLFHRGHSWARIGDDGIVTLGVDDFTRRMTGRPDKIILPGAGVRLVQGERGWCLRRNERVIPMVAPMDGEVVERNESALRDPSVVEADPYGNGWLLKIRPSALAKDRRNLFDGGLAIRWMEDSFGRLSRFFSPELGEVMQDGGEVASDIIDAIAPEQFESALREFFLIDQ